MTPIALLPFFGRWWDNLVVTQQVFYGIGIVAALLVLVLAVMAMFGMEHDDAMDAIGGDTDLDGGGIFSVKPLVGFFLGFGWAGGFAIEHGFSLPIALLFAFGAGGGLMGIIVVMLRAILSMRSDGTARISESVGAVGTVYVSLPPAKATGGQVIVSFSNRQETFQALNTSDRPVPSGDRVKVVGVIDSRTVLVEPLT